MAASNKMFTREWFELINDMVRLLRPIILRPVIIVRKAFIQKPKMTEKTKTKTGYKYMVKNNKTSQIIKHNRNFTGKYQGKKS